LIVVNFVVIDDVYKDYCVWSSKLSLSHMP